MDKKQGISSNLIGVTRQGEDFSFVRKLFPWNVFHNYLRKMTQNEGNSSEKSSQFVSMIFSNK